MSAGKTGRPRGAVTFDRPVADAAASRCPACQSTNRAPYDKSPDIIEGSGTDPQGRPYSAVELRPTHCLDCGQRRTDRTWRYLPGESG